VKLAITLEHHDHAYVERRGGWELLTHLRGAEARVEFRRQVIRRAWDAFDQAGAADESQARVTGLGLIVLQRALLAAEDLGGVLHALGGPDPWVRVRTASIADMDAAYERAVRDTETVVEESFRLAVANDLHDEGVTPDEVDALMRLRGRLMTRWERMLITATRLWLDHRDVAKASMHGFPIVAGNEVFGPPSAGKLAAAARPSTHGRFAVAVNSRQHGRDIQTTPTTVRLDDDAVAGYRRDGRMAARLYGEICAMQAQSIMSGHKAGIPLGLIKPGSERDIQLIEAAVERTNDDADE
jgi:hypothetical protein